jgi:hypothetical protein
VPLVQGKTPGETVHLRATALMDLTHLDYQAAVNQVLAADPALKAAYARSWAMSKRFDSLVDEALHVESELRRLAPGRLSLRCFISLCLERAGEDYSAVEQVKERLAEPLFGLKSGCATFIRDLSRQIASGRFPEPPAKGRVGGLYFNQKHEAIMELGGRPEGLFLLWVIAAEVAYGQEPGVFGGVEDLAGHKARLAELEGKRKDLHERIARGWDTSDIVLGPIATDFAALVSWKMAPDVPVGKDAIAERLIEYLLAGPGGGHVLISATGTGLSQNPRFGDD